MKTYYATMYYEHLCVECFGALLMVPVRLFEIVLLFSSLYRGQIHGPFQGFLIPENLPSLSDMFVLVKMHVCSQPRKPGSIEPHPGFLETSFWEGSLTSIKRKPTVLQTRAGKYTQSQPF